MIATKSKFLDKRIHWNIAINETPNLDTNGIVSNWPNYNIVWMSRRICIIVTIHQHKLCLLRAIVVKYFYIQIGITLKNSIIK